MSVGHGRLSLIAALGGRSAPPSLRRHYPDQVQTVGGPDAALSAPAHGAPVVASMVLRAGCAILQARWPPTAINGSAALEAARLYFVCEGLPRGGDPGPLLDAALRGGADIVQLREKSPRCDDELIALADPFRRAAAEHGALFILNDRPDLVAACEADGVHVGQDDMPVAEARAAGRPRGAGRALDPFPRAGRGGLRGHRRGPPRPDQRRPGLGDADQGGPARRPGSG